LGCCFKGSSALVDLYCKQTATRTQTLTATHAATRYLYTVRAKYLGCCFKGSSALMDLQRTYDTLVRVLMCVPVFAHVRVRVHMRVRARVRVRVRVRVCVRVRVRVTVCL